jgi:hypothetical protein
MYVVDIFTVISIDRCLLNFKIKFHKNQFLLVEQGSCSSCGNYTCGRCALHFEYLCSCDENWCWIYGMQGKNLSRIYFLESGLFVFHLHCKDTIPKILNKNIPRKGIVWPQSQFPHSCVCEQFIYSHDRSAYSAAGKNVDWSGEYINRSQTHECGNWDWGWAIHEWDFLCSVVRGIFF